jgi:hypothetical protein
VLFAIHPRNAIPAIANGFNNFFMVFILAMIAGCASGVT